MSRIPTLETPRLTLRPFRADEVDAVTELINDPLVSATLDGIPYPYYRAYAEHWISLHESLFAERGELHLAVEQRASLELMGAVALLHRDGEVARHLGYWLGRRFWGCGYATEAVRAIVGYARQETRIGAVEARCMTENGASLVVLERAGLRRVGPGEPVLKDGCVREVYAYVLEFERQ